MSYPASVTTAQVVLGDAIDFHGAQLTARVFVTPLLGGAATHLVHEPSGTILAPLQQVFESPFPGAAVSFPLPHVDQAGFRDESGVGVTGWSYHVLVYVFRSGGERIEYEKTFQVIIGQDVVDLDLVAGGPTIDRMTTIVPGVTSVNGKTGNVVMTGEAATDAALAVIQSVAAERDVRVSELRRYRGQVPVRKKAAVTLVMDHGLNAFDAKVRPLLEARGLPVTLALNSNWQDTTDARYSTNNLVTPAMVKAWIDAGWLEPANHGRSHSGHPTDEAMTTEIVTGRQDLEAMLGHRVDSWVQPSMTTGDGFDSGGDQTEYWSTHTGRTILRSHAVVSGLAPDGSLYPLDGEPVIGMKGGWIDTGTAGVESAISSAISSGTGYVVRFHPQYLDQAGYLTTAQLTAFLDKLVTQRNGGDIDVLQLRDFAIAERVLPSQDTGKRNVHSLFAGTPTGGVIYLRRTGNVVELNVYAVGFTGINTTLYKLPVGFQPDYHRIFAASSFTSTGGRFLIYGSNGGANAGNIVSMGNTDGTYYVSFMWITSDPHPTSLPGVAG